MAQFGDQPDQPRRFMGIELVHDKYPVSKSIRLDRRPDMRDKILLGPSVADRGVDHLPRHHVKVGDQGLGPVSNIFKLLGLRFARFHRPGGMEPLQRLDAGFLISTDQVHPLLIEFKGLVVQAADRPDLLPEGGFVRHLMIQPVTDLMRF